MLSWQNWRCRLLWEHPGGVPELELFEVRRINDNPFAVMLNLRVTGLSNGQRVRVDGGAGHVVWVDAAEGSAQRTAALEYSKIGDYTIAVELVDSHGFFVATLGEAPLSIEEPVAAEPGVPATPVAEAATAPAAAIPVEMSEFATASASATPWLPFRYARPAWAWARTYKAAGSSVVSRSLAPGTYLAIRQETVVGGQLWYQTGGYDWIPASSVGVLTPSELRGVELQGPTPVRTHARPRSCALWRRHGACAQRACEAGCAP